MMHILWLRLRAPFAAFRYFQAGTYRASSPTIPHSAAWGLVLNLAGRDVRINSNNPTTEIDPSAPKLLLAIGSVSHSDKSTLYQQLHSYPVGTSGQEFAERTKGAKYWIAPVKREILSDFDAMLGVQSENDNILKCVEQGLTGNLPIVRYGLPFAGDNNLLFDRIDILDSPVPAYWYCPVRDTDEPPASESCRLSVKIDRLDSSKGVNLLFAPEATKMETPPPGAWIWTPTQI